MRIKELMAQTASENLYAIMRKRKLTQRALASTLHISPAYLNDLLHERRELSVIMAVRIETTYPEAIASCMLEAQMTRQIAEARRILEQENEE